MADCRVRGGPGRRWVQAGVVAAGVGAALMGAHGVAAAETERGTGSPDRNPGAAAPSTTAKRAAASTRPTAGPAVKPSVTPRAGASGGRTKPRAVDRPVAVAERANRTTAGTGPNIGPIQAAILAGQAYVYGYPLLEFERLRSEAPSPNAITSFTEFASADVEPIGRPNVDTFYSLAELDLADGPVVLSIPDMGDRYFSFQFNDPYTNVVGYIGSRTTGSGPARYAITWEDGPSIDIDGAQTVLVPYSRIRMIGRTLAGDEADQLAAIGLIDQYTLTPPGPADPFEDPMPRSGSGIELLDAISAAMELNTPPARDDEQLAAMALIGVGPGLRVADAALGPVATRAADSAVRLTAALIPIASMLEQYRTATNHQGWATPDPDIGNYGTDYRLRAGVFHVGPWANVPQEAVYAAGLVSRNLLPMTGLRDYVLHFAPGQAPPVGAFWSVTVYDAAGHLVPNADNRYSVSSSRPGDLVYRPDGSLDIIFSRSDPGDPGANWLPVPVGVFQPYLRMYGPDEAVLAGTWKAPGITVVRRSWF